MHAEKNAIRAEGSPSAQEDIRIQVSALVDGELDDATIQKTIDALLASDDLATFWADAHRAGDWMRSDEVIGVGDGEQALRRIAAELAGEPTILAPKLRGKSRGRRFWVRTGLPGASVAAALVVVAWVASPLVRDDASTSTVAAVARPTVAIVPAEAVAGAQSLALEPELKTVDAERLSDYFAAHRDVTPYRYRGGPAAVPARYSPSGANGDSTQSP